MINVNVFMMIMLCILHVVIWYVFNIPRLQIESSDIVANYMHGTNRLVSNYVHIVLKTMTIMIPNKGLAGLLVNFQVK